MHDLEKVLHGDIIDTDLPRRRREIAPIVCYYVEQRDCFEAEWWSYVVYPSRAMCL
jgi:hypothetical protein